MPLEILRQSNFNGGELSPQAVGRRDLKVYTSSLALCVNMMPMAEGPVKRRPGLRHLDRVRNRLEAVPTGGASVTTPNGGTGAAVLTGDGLETTTAIGSTDHYVVCEIDFGTPTRVGLVDLTDFVIKPASGGGGGLDPLPDPVPPQYPWDRPLTDLP